MAKCKLYLLLSTVCFVFSLHGQAYASYSQQNLKLANNEEVSFNVYGKNDHSRILWVSSSYGFNPRHQHAAELLAKNGMEVWQVDFVEHLFLPKGADSIRSVANELVANVIEQVSANGKYSVVILTSGYGTIPVLRGVHAWQEKKDKKARLIGAITFSPYLYMSVPTLGMAPELVPVTRVTNIPVYIFQAEKNGNRAHLQDMLNALQNNAPVYTKLNKGITSLFYEEDTAPETLSTLANFPGLIANAIAVLRKHPVPSKAIELVKKKPGLQPRGLNIALTPYKGRVTAEPVTLKDANGHDFVVSDYKGKVTLINFWASWCPPCVEEIPSLNQLKEKMKHKPFQLISVNYAESAEQIHNFMKKVKVEFPVLLDTDGTVSAKWKVVAYPSTFVIGSDGKIKYGVNAAIHWDTEQVIEQLEKLMP